MKYFIKKNITAVIIAIVIFIGVLVGNFFYAHTYDTDIFSIEKFQIEAVVNEDGSVRIKERITVEFDNDANGEFWRDIVTSKNSNGVSTNTSSIDLSTFSLKIYDERGTEELYNSITGYKSNYIKAVGTSWEADKDYYGDRIYCYGYDVPCVSSYSYLTTRYPTRIYEYEYTLKGFVTCYDDVCEINNNFFDPIETVKTKNISVKINFPKSSENIELFTHKAIVKNEVVSKSFVSYEIDKLYPGDAIESRVIFPRSFVTNPDTKNVILGNGYDYLKRLENEISSADKIIMEYGNVLVIGLGIIFIVIFGFAIFSAYMKFDKELISDFYGDYYRELPANYPPAEMGYLVNFKEINENDMTATLLDLIRKGYIEVDYTNQSLTDKNANYTLFYNRNKDKIGLTSYEVYLLEWYFDIIGGGSNAITMNQLEDYANDDKYAERYYNCNRKWKSLVDKEAKKKGFFDLKVENAKTSIYGILVALVFIVGLSGVGLSFSMDTYIIALPYVGALLLSISIVGLSYLSNIKRRSVQGNEDYVRWMAFKKFLSEFGNMQDYPIPAIQIWEHYLVYAASFGIADLVSKQLEMKFENGEYREQTAYKMVAYNTYMDYRMRRIYYNASMSYARVQAAKAQRSSSSGRSRFGGGSSFGGGGGGARGR